MTLLPIPDFVTVDLGPQIDEMIAESLALTQHLAAQSRDASNRLCCCVCGGRDALICVGKGYGGVFACRSCSAETSPEGSR